MVSLIIPVYNVEAHIKSSLISAFNQTYQDIEFIIVDDCGTDSSMDIVLSLVESSEYSNKHIKLISHKTNKGLSAARNTGVEYSSGDYIFFMDSDDEISDNCIELHLKALQNSSADFTIANVRLIGAKSIHINEVDEKIVNDMPILQSFLRRKWSVSAWNKLYRKNFLLDNNILFEEGLIHEDIIWSYKVAKAAQKLAVVHDQTYKYKINNCSITRKPNSNKKIDSLLFVLKQIAADRGIRGLKSEYSKFICYWAFNSTLLLLNFDGDLKSQKLYYRKLQMLTESCGLNVYRCALLLPYSLYKVVMKPLYNIYKRMM